MVYKIYRWYVLSILIAWVSLNAWAWWVLGSIETCNLGFRLLGFIVWGCSMSILSLVLVIPPISDSNKISWEEILRELKIEIQYKMNDDYYKKFKSN